MDEEVRALLEQEFPGSQVTVEREPGVEKVGGWIVWEGFENKDPLDRQLQVYALLRDRLGADSQQVSMIFTYTPNEFDLMGAA